MHDSQKVSTRIQQPKHSNHLVCIEGPRPLAVLSPQDPGDLGAGGSCPKGPGESCGAVRPGLVVLGLGIVGWLVLKERQKEPPKPFFFGCPQIDTFTQGAQRWRLLEQWVFGFYVLQECRSHGHPIYQGRHFTLYEQRSPNGGFPFGSPF